MASLSSSADFGGAVDAGMCFKVEMTGGSADQAGV